MTSLKPCLGPGESLVPCMSADDACTCYPYAPGAKQERLCCPARRAYGIGGLTLERLAAACETLACRQEEWVDI